MEDRGKSYFVWTDRDGARFQPFMGMEFRHTISVPIGWSFVPHESKGVILHSVYNETLDALEALCKFRRKELVNVSFGG